MTAVELTLRVKDDEADDLSDDVQTLLDGAAEALDLSPAFRLLLLEVDDALTRRLCLEPTTAEPRCTARRSVVARDYRPEKTWAAIASL